METMVETPGKKGGAGEWVTRRRLWLCCVLFFVAGLLVGGAGGIFVLRHRLRFPPDLDQVSDFIISRIRKDFDLDAAAGEELAVGVKTLAADIHKTAIATWKEMDVVLVRHAESLGRVFPEGEPRERWRRDFRKYFPPPPPPPPMPAPSDTPK